MSECRKYYQKIKPAYFSHNTEILLNAPTAWVDAVNTDGSEVVVQEVILESENDPRRVDCFSNVPVAGIVNGRVVIYPLHADVLHIDGEDGLYVEIDVMNQLFG
jgi:hypothetical protein